MADDDVAYMRANAFLSPTPIRIELSGSPTLLEKRHIFADVKMALSFDDELQPLYTELKLAKIMDKRMWEGGGGRGASEGMEIENGEGS